MMARFSCVPVSSAMPKRAGSQGRVHVLGCRTRERDLEVVDDAGPVGRDRRHEPTLHQVHQHRRQTGLEDVGAEAPDDGAPVAGAPTIAARPPP